MARRKKNPENSSSNDENVEQITKALQQLTVKKKKKKKMPEEPQRGKTPYQGKKQCFGLYECPKCKNEWASSHSWANTWQECLECRGKVYPHRQWPKKKRGKKTGDKPHLQQYCGKCLRLGYYCGNQE